MLAAREFCWWPLIPSGVLMLLGQVSERPFLLAYLNSCYATGIPNPIDAAILAAPGASGLDLTILRHDHPDIHDYRKVDEIPFDFERCRMSVVVETRRVYALGRGRAAPALRRPRPRPLHGAVPATEHTGLC